MCLHVLCVGRLCSQLKLPVLHFLFIHRPIFKLTGSSKRRTFLKRWCCRRLKRGGSHPVEVNLCLRITLQITFQLTGPLPTPLTNAYSTFDLVQQSTPRPAYAATPKAKLTCRRRNLTGVTIRIIIFNFKLFTPRLRRLWQPNTGYPDTSRPLQ
jgi:hypothetical protein